MNGVIISFILFFIQQHCLAGWQHRSSDKSQISRNLNLQSHSKNVTVSIKFKPSTMSKGMIDLRLRLLAPRKLYQYRNKDYTLTGHTALCTTLQYCCRSWEEKIFAFNTLFCLRYLSKKTQI